MTLAAEPLFSVEVVVLRLYQQQLYVYLTPQASSSSTESIYSLINGPIDYECDKNIENTVKRLIEAELNAEASYIEQVKTIGNATRHPDGWMVASVYYALLPQLATRSMTNWFPVKQLDKLSLAYDHLALIHSSLRRLKDKAQYTSMPLHLMPAEFTLSELQRCFENIMQSYIQKKAFRRRLLEAGLLIALDRERRGKSRPAQLYRIKRGHIIHHFSRKMFGKAEE